MSAAPALLTTCGPAATNADAADDVAWFDSQRSRRRYRLRAGGGGWWIIRGLGGVLLRTWTTALPPGPVDTDRALRRIWVDTAWAGLTPLNRQALLKEIVKGERLYDR